jgi:hypothetical protein
VLLLYFCPKKSDMGLIEHWVQTTGRVHTSERLEIMASYTKAAMDKVDETTSSVLDDVVDFLKEIQKEVLAGEH